MADPEAIYNWQRLDNRITTSGQPTEKQLADIHALGVRHIEAVRLARRPHPSDNSGHVHIPEHAERAAVLAVSMWCELPI
jgi:hypothetical protein